MISLKDTKDELIAGTLNKSEYIKKMYNLHHSHLFDYAKYMTATDIESILISDGKVIMTSKKYGVHMLCPESDHRVVPMESLNFGSYEDVDSDMIMALMPENGVFFDIGANMGWYSLLSARKSKDLQIHAFEPIPKTYSFLENNIETNQFKNIIAYNFGFSNESKDLKFYFYPEGSGNASSANLSEREDVEIVRCHVERMDDFVSKNELHVDFIKCDVEGAELMVFQGGINTIETNKPIVFTEILRKWSAKFNYNPNEIFEYFRKNGYSAYTAKESGLIEFKSMDESTIETNFFFLHTEKHKNIIDIHANDAQSC
jgi:FkbM family methyltransferase